MRRDISEESGLGNLFGTFNIAQTGLQAAQVQLEVAGHNIANVNREGFSRQRAELTFLEPTSRSYGLVGGGVRIQDVSRIRDEFLDIVFREQNPGLSFTEVRATYFNRMEDLFQEPGENGFGTRLSFFFDALNDFANNVEELPVRQSVITEAQSLTSLLNQLAQNIQALRTNANEEVINIVPEINSLSERIAALNQNIADAELGGAKANDVRDERDLLLDQLSGLINISFRERDNGEVDVFIAGDVVVGGSEFREMAAVRDPTLDPVRLDLVAVRFVDNDQDVDIRDGELAGALAIRDESLVLLADDIDMIAATIIEQVNRIHANGNGLDNLSGAITGTNAVNDSTNTLDAAGLPFDVTPGTFDVVVYDAANVPTTTTITITTASTLDSLVADLNGIPNFSASVTANNTISLSATAPSTFSFANDTSNVLTALGVNGLFTGTDALTMGINQDLLDNPRLITSGYSLDILETGDNSAALDMANLRTAQLLGNNSSTVNDFYESTIVRVGVDARANTDTLQVQQAFVDDFNRRRQEVSGVSIDEEVTNMLQYQRAYEASARVITTVDRMLDALLAMGA
ncbi:MAG: flagellar hook-associated protein FlgK [Nitrospiraceae bacterium]|nr:flagellar hook-associated protein FlgK [Nitrospiraceae bacterium]